VAGNELEEMIDQMEADAIDFLKEAGKTVTPFDMIPERQADQLFDWQNRMSVPDYWARITTTAISQAMTSGGTLGDAMLSVMEHDQKMQRLDEGER
jgi:hypothetical protein